MKASQLVEMIRKIVAEEVKKQLPGIVSEMYLKKIVSETVAHQPEPFFVEHKPETRPLSLEQAFEIEMAKLRDESIPEPLDNDDEGIYQQGTITRKNESVRNKLMVEGPYAAMFEGVVPTNQRAAQAVTSVPIIPPTEVDTSGRKVIADPSKYGEIFRRSQGHSPKSSMKQTPEAEMRRIQQMREMLDAKKV